MFQETKADIFIKTLAEMLESQRAQRQVKLRRQHRAHAERFIQTYRTDPDAGLQPLTWQPEARQADSPSHSWAD